MLFYVNQDLNCKVLNKYPTRQDFEILVLELKLSKINWLVIVTYKPPSLSDIAFTSKISNILTFYRSTHDNILLMGDFDMTPNNPKLSELIDDHELCTLISEPTCFKSINPTCIDNFLTNKKVHFMKTLTFETGVSDHHKRIGTMLRSTFAKGKPKKMFYRYYKNFDNKRFEEELQKQLLSVSNFEPFQFAFKVILNQFAPLKQKLIRNNNQPFMTKTLPKAIMKRSKLRNKFNEERNIENWSEYKCQRNLCSNLLKQSKKRHFNNLNVRDVTENKQFWKTIKPFFTEKNKTTNNIILTENNQTVREDKAICQIFNTYFTNVTKGLQLRQVDESQSFENEESCRLIKENWSGESFSFKSISKDDIIEAVKKLPSNKASISNDIPISIIKNFATPIVKSLQVIAEISPVFKKLDNTSKYNYRPISTLSNFTKLFESIVFTQLNEFMQNKFSKYLTGFRKNHNTQNSLLSMIESWKFRLNNGSKVGVTIMDLSKAFDSLNHELLLTRLKAYSLDSNSVTFMKSFLTNKLQHCKINNSFNDGGKYLMVSHKDLF